jgi:CHAD domain-containing protein
MAVAGRKILQVQFARMLKREPGTRSGRDIEDLHRMRVATRRMRTAFEILGKYYRKKKIKPIVKGLRKTGRALGRVRDYDVLIQKTSSFFLSGLPENSLEHEPLIKIWLEERNIARIKMLVYLDSSKYKIFKKRFKDFIFSDEDEWDDYLPPDVNQPKIHRSVIPLILERWSVIQAFEATSEHASIERLHALRIEFKKLRYSLEYFQSVFDEDIKILINIIKSIQEHLGDLNDADVACKVLTNLFGGSTSEISSTNYSNVMHESYIGVIRGSLLAKQKEREYLHTTFVDVWKGFLDSGFPNSIENLSIKS